MKVILSPFIIVIIGVSILVGNTAKYWGSDTGKIADSTPMVDPASHDPAAIISPSENKYISSIELHAQSSAMIDFKTHNGVTIDGEIAREKRLAHLVLYRNGELTDPRERTLVITINSLPAASTGITLTIRLETQHPDPDLWRSGRAIIPVWETRQQVSQPQNGSRTTITHTFGADATLDENSIPTPTDYYRMSVLLTDSQHTEEEPLFIHEETSAFLLENQWLVALPKMSEEVPGAAPDELVVYYCDMFVYQHDHLDPRTRLVREEVDGFVRDSLLPSMLDAVQLQSETWGFTWYSEWYSYREGVDAERMSVALTSPGVWYHGRAPSSAHSGISLNTSNQGYAEYDRLIDGMMSAFHHELFHNLQRNINLGQGGDGDIDADGDAWASVTEGMAVMVASVAMPEIEFYADGSYLTQVNAFLAGGSFSEPDLNTRYGELDPYRTAIYWRFLYEQCGGSKGNNMDQAAGMRVIRRTLELLYAAGIVDAERFDIAQSMQELMDRVLDGQVDCPFRTYRESLADFSRTIYTLRVAGMCAQDKYFANCGFYNPDGKYSNPPVDEIAFSDGVVEFAGGVPSSYGMDFVEVSFMDDQEMEIEFHDLSAVADFEVQLMRVDELEAGLIPGENVVGEDQSGVKWTTSNQHVQTIRLNEANSDERLAVIVTRVDGSEVIDPVGEYSIVFRR